MIAVCPKNREHKEFKATAHIVQEWMVDNKGEFIKIIDDCLEITHNVEHDYVWYCAKCNEPAILGGEIIELFATVLENEEYSYADIYDNEEEARAQIGTYVDDLKVVNVIKGYSIAPRGSKILYDEAPDFCFTKEEAINIANTLGIELV